MVVVWWGAWVVTGGWSMIGWGSLREIGVTIGTGGIRGVMLLLLLGMDGGRLFVEGEVVRLRGTRIERCVVVIIVVTVVVVAPTHVTWKKQIISLGFHINMNFN